MCSGSDDSDANKLRKFQRMQGMHRQQTEETGNSINQSAGGFSLINIQWASFATGATAIIVCAMFFLAVLLCCWIRSCSVRQSRARHGQLLDLLRSSVPPLAAPLSPCQSQELPPARSSPLGNLALPSLSQPLTLTHQGGCGPPPVGPLFPRPMPSMTDCSPGCHTRSSHLSFTMGATSTTPSASAAFWDAVPDSFQYRSRPRLDYDRREDSGRFIELDSSPRSRGASPVRRSVRVTEPSEPAARYRAQRAQSCQTSHPPSPRSRRNSVSAVAVDTGVDAFDEVLVDVE